MALQRVNRVPKNIIPFKLWHIEYIAQNMRDDEIEQYMAFRGLKEYDPDEAAIFFANIPNELKYTLISEKGEPLMCGGYYCIKAGVWNSFMAATPEAWETHWRSITKAVRWLMTQLIDGGADRLQTTCLSKRKKTIEWYKKSLGMKFEGKMLNYCGKGVHASMFAVIPKENKNGIIG